MINSRTFIGTGTAAVAIAALLAYLIVMANIDFQQRITGHLKLAADASTIEKARSQLQIALKAIEDKNLVQGSSHAIWSTPGTDMGFWYGNLKDAHTELAKFDDKAPPLVVSNQLMKLRETLLDDTGDGVEVTVPASAWYHPWQKAFLLGEIGAVLLGVVGVIGLLFGIQGSLD